MEEYLQIESGIVLKCTNFNVQKIVLDDTIKKIERNAFNAFMKECTLEEIIISDTVTAIDKSILEYCRSLKKIIIDKNNPVYNSGDNNDSIIETKTGNIIFKIN